MFCALYFYCWFGKRKICRLFTHLSQCVFLWNLIFSISLCVNLIRNWSMYCAIWMFDWTLCFIQIQWARCGSRKFFFFFLKFSSLFASFLTRSRQFNSIHLVNCNKIVCCQMSKNDIVGVRFIWMKRSLHTNYVAQHIHLTLKSLEFRCMHSASAIPIFIDFQRNFDYLSIILRSNFHFPLFSAKILPKCELKWNISRKNGPRTTILAYFLKLNEQRQRWHWIDRNRIEVSERSNRSSVFHNNRNGDPSFRLNRKHHCAEGAVKLIWAFNW